MIFKSLILHGFKSFADRTEFHFDEGITGIVGPNGCGKSNLVDAVKWVLGEQSAKSLRGQNMLDVIFNGSGTRKSASLAEVELVFDNRDGTLPIDQSEVTVARRLFRSGESEYRLNKQPVRLRDIKELFLDTGVGADAYSMIEQGKVDALLQANPQERRAIFEEAAGVAKYKARRKEAERKLDRTEQNLMRVQDIIDEVEKRLRSVKLQAGKARNYREYAARLSELRSSYALAEFHRLTQEHTETGRQEAALADRSAALRASISHTETEEVRLDAKVLELNEIIQRIDDQGLRVQAEVHTQEERVAHSRQRTADQEAVLERCRRRLLSQRQHAVGLRHRAEETADQVARCDEEIESRHAEMSAVAVEEEAEARQVTSLQAELEDEKSGLIDLLRRSSQLSNEIQGLDVHRQSLTGEKGRLSARGDQISSALEQAMVRKAQLEAQRREVEALIADQTQRLEDKKQQASQVASDRAVAAQELAAAKEDRSALQSRRQILDDLARQLEGVEAGVQELLRQRDTDETQRAFDYVAGLVGQFVETEVGHATVIEAALGELDQYVVVTDSKRFFADGARLAELSGRVSALCLDRLPPYVAAPDLRGQPGVLARAIDLVRPTARVGGELLPGPTTQLSRDQYDRLIRHLLDRTVVVETLDHARQLCGAFPGNHRFVTRDGQVLEPDGRVAVGPAGTRAGLVARQSQIRELDQHLEDAERRIAVLSDRENRLGAEVQHLDRIQQELRTAVYEAHTARAGTVSRLESSSEEVARLTREQPLVAGEIERLEQAIAEAVERADKSKDTLAEVARLNAEREERVTALQERLDAAVERRSVMRDQVTELRVAIGQQTEKRSAADQTQRTLEREAVEADRTAAAAREEAAECAGRIERAERAILVTQSRLAELYLRKEKTRADGLARRRAREELLSAREQLAAEIKTVREALEAAEAGLHEQQMRVQEIRVRREELVNRVRDELDIDLPERYAETQGPVAEQDETYWAQVEAEIAELRGKIDRLGNVNLDAIAEQEELEERGGFLTTQRDDLGESRRQLEQLIAKLNHESRDRFVKAFEEIRKHFQELFRRLFGGGKADIMLEDEDDVLESGIEIIARPPGKEPQRISLLSGGEKSMTAIALLLAIFRSKPSPFAILDEVDAALDEANNERFNRIIQDFTNLSQFIIVTHSKRTMAVTNRLYGVTMQEAGVSKLVSVKFDEATSAA